MPRKSRKSERGEGGHAPQKKKRKAVSFVELEAQEESSDEEESEGEDGFREVYREAEEASRMQIREMEKRMKDRCLDENGRRGGANYLESAIGNLERRFQDQDYTTGDDRGQRGGEGTELVGEGEEDDEDDEYEYDEEGGLLYGEGGQLDLSRILPGTAGHWKLWKVPTLRPGGERDACIQVLKKFAELSEEDKADFPVAACFASDFIKSAIYVEAPSPLHIVDALSDCNLIISSRRHINLVPVKEMADVFNVAASQKEMPKRGHWVRFNRGLYAGDLGLVSDVEDTGGGGVGGGAGGGMIVVRVVPRLNLAYEARAVAAEQEGGERLPPLKSRPAPMLVTLTDCDSRGIPTERTPSITEAFRFRSHVIEERTGYLIRSVKVSTVTTGDKVKATAAEIEAFADGKDLNELLGEDLGVAVEGCLDVSGSFDAGQDIYVASGDLQGIRGKVISVKDGTLRIQPSEADILPFEVPASQCVKWFEVGDSVRVMVGKHANDMGLIVSVNFEENEATLLSIETHQQITCQLAHLSTSTNDAVAAAGLTKLEGYALGDLVQVTTTQDAGVIIKISRSRRLDILTADDVINCDISQIAGRKTLRLTQGLDRNNRQFGPGESVEILEGAHAKKAGMVKYIWKNTVFVSIPSAVSTAGIVPVDCTAVQLLQSGAGGNGGMDGGGHNNVTAATATGANETGIGGGMDPRRPGAPGAGGPGMGGPGGGPMMRGVRPLSIRTHHALMGTKVKIVFGRWKGLMGELRGLNGPQAIVLITSIGAEKHLPKSSLQLIDPEQSAEVGRLFFRGSGPPRMSGY